MRDIFERENTAPNQVVPHPDNGSPMKGAAMLTTLQALGVMPSFSRPVVSNDHPFSEPLFKTLKYRPAYPSDRLKDPLPPGSGSALMFGGVTMNIVTVPSATSPPQSAMRVWTPRVAR